MYMRAMENIVGRGEFNCCYLHLHCGEKYQLLVTVILFALTLEHTILICKDPEEEDWKTLLEKEKMLVSSIFSFSHSVFYLCKANFNISAAFILSFCKALIKYPDQMKVFIEKNNGEKKNEAEGEHFCYSASNLGTVLLLREQKEIHGVWKH